MKQFRTKKTLGRKSLLSRPQKKEKVNFAMGKRKFLQIMMRAPGLNNLQFHRLERHSGAHHFPSVLLIAD